jgi:hypothetical protein
VKETFEGILLLLQSLGQKITAQDDFKLEEEIELFVQKIKKKAETGVQHK